MPHVYVTRPPHSTVSPGMKGYIPSDSGSFISPTPRILLHCSLGGYRSHSGTDRHESAHTRDQDFRARLLHSVPLHNQLPLPPTLPPLHAVEPVTRKATGTERSLLYTLFGLIRQRNTSTRLKVVTRAEHYRAATDLEPLQKCRLDAYKLGTEHSIR